MSSGGVERIRAALVVGYAKLCESGQAAKPHHCS